MNGQSLTITIHFDKDGSIEWVQYDGGKKQKEPKIRSSEIEEKDTILKLVHAYKKGHKKNEHDLQRCLRLGDGDCW